MRLFTVLLYLLHFAYSLILRFRHLWRQWSSLDPLPLQTPRQRIPSHLAILFVVDPKSDTETTHKVLTESTLRVVRWSRTIGVKKLTVYEENGQSYNVQRRHLTKANTGLLSHCTDDIRSALPVKHCNFSGSEDEYQPPTPPLSDYADSLPQPPSRSSSVVTLVITQQSPHKHENRTRKYFG